MAYLAATAFTAASAATNYLYAVNKMVDVPSQIVWGTVAIAASVALALAPSAFMASLDRRRYGAATLSMLALLMFGAYSVTAALGSATGSRLTAAATATDATDARAIAREAYGRASSRLATLAPARPAGDVEAAVAALVAKDQRLLACDAWTESKAVRIKCAEELAPLKAELARSLERSKLTAEVDAAATAMRAVRSTDAVANTDAVALVGYAKAVGWTVDTDTMNRLLVILATLTIEFGGGLAFALAGSLRPSTPSALSTSQPLPPAAAPAPEPILALSTDLDTVSTVDVSNVVMIPLPDSRRADGVDEASKRVVAALSANGGRMSGSVRSLAAVVNAGRSTTHNAIASLVAAGTVARDDADLVLVAGEVAA